MVEELMIKRLYRAIELMTRVFFVYQWTRLILYNFSDLDSVFGFSSKVTMLV